MKSSIYFLVFLLIINQVHTYLRGDQREELIAKLAVPITEENVNKFYEDVDDLYEEGKFQKMTYDLDEILALMKQYNLPERFNFFDSGIEKDVKNQQSCGCCWSFSSTSSLAYRYNKLGEKVSLSPQDGVSCYWKKCDGNNLLDPHLNLVKNGTVTEQCLPYKSGDGKTIPKCPTTCEDGSEYKKYYAQNAYNVQSTQQNFKDLVILIMDQLVTEGPVSTGFNVYRDFYTFSNVPENCLNKVYSYDGTSQIDGGHAVTIVGYGVLDNKIYWLIQNSWGKSWCDNGFIKMEIGQFIEVSFSQPLITSGSKTPVEIEVTSSSQNPDCNYIAESSSIQDWNNTVFVNFEHEAKTHTFEFQIGKNKLNGKETINSFYEINRVYLNMRKGIYTYKNSSTYGKDNIFNLNAFEKEKFTFYGADQIYSTTNKVYVSKVGSKMVFIHGYAANDATLPPMILYGTKTRLILSNCQHIKTSTKLSYEFGYCEMNQDEINLLQSEDQILVTYRYLCNYLYSAQFYLVLLGTKNPVFNIINFYQPENTTELDSKTKLLITATVSGSVESYKSDGQFYTLFEVENNKKNTTLLGICNATFSAGQEQSNFICNLDTNKLVYPFEDIYLLPYNLIKKASTVFEVFIEKEIKAKNATPPGPDPEPTTTEDPKPTISSYLVYYQTLTIALLLLLL